MEQISALITINAQIDTNDTFRPDTDKYKQIFKSLLTIILWIASIYNKIVNMLQLIKKVLKAFCIALYTSNNTDMSRIKQFMIDNILPYVYYNKNNSTRYEESELKERIENVREVV